MIQQLIDHRRAVVVAAAGCGKTEIIVDAVAQSKAGRQLVLTHTNAGVSSLTKRFKRKCVDVSKYNLQTIASFSAEYAYAFPLLSKAPPKEEYETKHYYNQIYEGAEKVFSSAVGQRILRASYAGIFVDEYQDCNLLQHKLIKALAEVLPCRILGDPMQGVFAFANNDLVDWDRDVYPYFECVGELKEPWRWKNTNPELGDWIMKTRTCLERNEPIDLTQLPPTAVYWLEKDDSNQNQRNSCYHARSNKIGPCVAIHRLPNPAHKLAGQLKGQFFSDEEVEGKDLLNFCRVLESADNWQAATKMIEFASCCATYVKTELKTIAAKVEKKEKNLGKLTKYIDLAQLLFDIGDTKSYQKCHEFLRGIEKHSNFIIYRKELWCEFKRVLRYCSAHEGSSPVEMARKFRSMIGLSKKYDFDYLVSRVLLIKGLEYDQAIVLDAESLTKKEFYVAISRARKRLVILSKKQVLLFQ